MLLCADVSAWGFTCIYISRVAGPVDAGGLSRLPSLPFALFHLDVPQGTPSVAQASARLGMHRNSAASRVIVQHQHGSKSFLWDGHTGSATGPARYTKLHSKIERGAGQMIFHLCLTAGWTR
jgi:hypothetical protein